jgi:hypothetical protein
VADVIQDYLRYVLVGRLFQMRPCRPDDKNNLLAEINGLSAGRDSTAVDYCVAEFDALLPKHGSLSPFEQRQKDVGA